MAHMHLHAGTGKLANIARRLKVGAGNDIAALVKDEGDAAHAGATDTDKMGALEIGRGGCSLGISMCSCTPCVNTACNPSTVAHLSHPREGDPRYPV